LGQGDEEEVPEGKEEADAPRAVKPKVVPPSSKAPPVTGKKPGDHDPNAERGGSRR
jgi:hypothetical protein